VKRIQRWSWIIPFTLALFVALFAVGAIASGVDPTEFEQSTGTAWTTVTQSTPAAAGYLVRLERLIGAGYGVFGIIWAALAWFFVRRGDLQGWFMLWSMPVTLLSASVIFLVDGAQSLCGYYLTLSVVSAIGLSLSGPTTRPIADPG
jgi:hypothetical protein